MTIICLFGCDDNFRLSGRQTASTIPRMITPMVASLVLIPVLVMGTLPPLPKDIDAEYKKITGYSLPPTASNVQMEKSTANDPSLPSASYCLISFGLGITAFNSIMDTRHDGFGEWRPFTEIRIGTHVLKSADMHHSLMTRKRMGDTNLAILLDFDHNKVYAMSYPD